MSNTIPDPFSYPAKVQREGAHADLPAVLAHERRLFARLRRVSSSLTGPQCYSLVKLMADHQRQLEYWLGQLLGRAEDKGRTLLDKAIRIVDVGRVSDRCGADPTPIACVLAELRAEHEALSRELRRVRLQLGNAPTVQVLQRLADFHDTAAWMICIVVEGPNRVWDKEICFRDAPDDSGRV